PPISRETPSCRIINLNCCGPTRTPTCVIVCQLLLALFFFRPLIGGRSTFLYRFYTIDVLSSAGYQSARGLPFSEVSLFFAFCERSARSVTQMWPSWPGGMARLNGLSCKCGKVRKSWVAPTL